MKKFFAIIGTLGLLGFSLGTVSAAVTGISVGSQTGSLTAGTAGTSTYTISFSKTNGNSDITGLSVSGLPAGASYSLSATSSSVSGNGPVPDVTLSIMTNGSAQAGITTFTVSSTNPVLSATGTLAIAAAATPPEACNGSTFDTFTTGTVNNQGGWHVIDNFDQSVVENTFGFPSFGCKSLRLSDATTSIFIYNQVFSNPATSEAGEKTALDSNGDQNPNRHNHFEAQFDLASVMQAEQPGMHLSVSPDRGDGTRMSSVGFVDTASGINVYFDDVTGTESPVTFRNAQIASNLTRATAHTIKFVIDFVEGASNDIVKVFVDGNLAHTGTSWENFYRYDSGAWPSPTASSSRTVNSLVFYEWGAANPSNFSNGFLIDNVALTSTTTSTGTSTPTLPIITLNGSSTMNITQNTTFTDPGATAVIGTTTIPVTATGTVNTAVIGGYTILYTATDPNDTNNVATTTRTVNVIAAPVSTSTLPIITLNGSSTMNIFLNSIFTDPGATAVSGTTTVPVVATGTVDTAVVGGYTILYTATDPNDTNNVATTTRTVNVVSTSTPPIITLNGSSTLSVTQNSTFTDPGATAVDAIGNPVTVTATGTVNTAVIGAYTITYGATDTNNNTATTTRTVNVTAVPVTPPTTTSSGGGGGGGSFFFTPIADRPGFVYAPLPGQGTTGSTGGLSPVAVGVIPSTGQVLGATVYNFTRNLRFGARGEDVMELQKFLIGKGFLILANPTQYFGPLTRAAVVRWQASVGLPATGYFGPLSRAEILR